MLNYIQDSHAKNATKIISPTKKMLSLTTHMVQIPCMQTRKRDKRQREAYKDDQLNERLEAKFRKERRMAKKRSRLATNSKKKRNLTDICIAALVEELGRVDEYGLTMRQLQHLLKLRHNLKRDKLVEKVCRGSCFNY